MITGSPGDRAVGGGGSGGGLGSISLTLDAHVHDVVTTDGTVVHLNVPGPHGHCVPLFNLKVWLLHNN